MKFNSGENERLKISHARNIAVAAAAWLLLRRKSVPISMSIVEWLVV